MLMDISYQHDIANMSQINCLQMIFSRNENADFHSSLCVPTKNEHNVLMLEVAY